MTQTQPSDDLSNRSVLVTGASKGIGRAIAIRLARVGYPLAVHCGRDRAGGEQTAEIIRAANGLARVVQFDVADHEETRRILANDMAHHGSYWGVVVNAGIARDNAFPALEKNDWDRVIRVNLDGFYNVIHPVIMPMIKRRDGGRIVVISSLSGVMGNRGQVSYSASKAGLIGAAKALALELAKRHITVNCVAPGLIETAMTRDVPVDDVKAMIPLRRVGRPEEVASLVSFLFSDDAAYITRQVISINGGIC